MFLNRNRPITSCVKMLYRIVFLFTFRRISSVLSFFNFSQFIFGKKFDPIEILNVQLAHPNCRRQAPFYDPIWILARTWAFCQTHQRWRLRNPLPAASRSRRRYRRRHPIFDDIPSVVAGPPESPDSFAYVVLCRRWKPPRLLPLCRPHIDPWHPRLAYRENGYETRNPPSRGNEILRKNYGINAHLIR